MASLNLATLSVEVQATGVNETERSINNLTGTMNSAQGGTNSFANSFSGLGNNMRSTIGQTQIFGTSLSSLGSAFTSAGGMATLMQGAVMGLTMALVQMATQAIQKAISALGDFVKKGVVLASDLQEVQNVVDTTFGEGAKQIDEWAESAVGAFGLTELQAKQFSSTLGSIMVSMGLTREQALSMSQGMTQLSGDMASFKNLKIEDSFEKIRAGIIGESEPLKAVGIILTETALNAYALSEGLSKTYREMSESEKVVLRYNYILSKTKDAQGDFAKTSESFSNSNRTMTNTIDDLGKTMGEGFLPQLAQFSNTMGKVLGNLKPVVELIGNLIGGALQTVFTLLQPIIDILNIVLSLLKPILNFINMIVDAVVSTVKAIGDGISGAINYFAQSMGIVQEQTKETAEYTTETIKEETDEALGYVTSATDKWVKAQMDNWKKQHEGMYADTLGGMIRYEKDYEAYEKRMQQRADKTADHYIYNEKRKTMTLEEQLAAREELENKHGKNKNSVTWQGEQYSKYATGTNYHTGGLAMVGELGRELVQLPRGTKVYNNRQTENMLNSGGSAVANTYYVTIPADNIKEFIDIINICNSNTQQYRMGVV